MAKSQGQIAATRARIDMFPVLPFGNDPLYNWPRLLEQGMPDISEVPHTICQKAWYAMG